jgi:hypothetical protein
VRPDDPRRPPPFSNDEILYALLGDSAPISPLRRLMIECRPSQNDHELWVRHRDFLVAEAKRRGIERPHHPDDGIVAFDFELPDDVRQRQQRRQQRRATRDSNRRFGLSTNGLEDGDVDD